MAANGALSKFTINVPTKFNIGNCDSMPWKLKDDEILWNKGLG